MRLFRHLAALLAVLVACMLAPSGGLVPAAHAALPPLHTDTDIFKALKSGLIPVVATECATNDGWIYNATTNLWTCDTPTNGTASGTGVAVAEYGSRAGAHKTVFTLTSVSVTTADHTTSGGSGGLLIYTFPEGITQVMGCSANLTTLSSGSITTTAAVVVSAGTVTAGADDTLTSTEANILPSMTATETASAGAATGYIGTVASYDGHSTPTPMYLNVAMPDAASSGAGAVAVSGTITCRWQSLGDY